MSHQSDLIHSDIDAYLLQHEQKDLLRLLTCGSVDDGKSTLIGRLLHDAKLIYEDQLAAITADSVKSGTTGDDVDLALLVDGLQAEREQGITIDVAYRFFSTAKRKFIIADTPGHEQYTRNMATGASTAELALLLIDARQGVQRQTLRHSMIAGLLGIRHFIVVVNKMDLVNYEERAFAEIRDAYRERLSALRPAWPGWEGLSHDGYHELAGTQHDDACRWHGAGSARRGHLSGENVLQGLCSLDFMPLSALKGDNVVNRGEGMSWYSGETLMHRLETMDIAGDTGPWPVRLPVQYVNRPSADFRGYCGNLAAGVLRAGDAVTVLPSGQRSQVASILGHEGALQRAYSPMAVTVTLEDDIDVSRGDMIVGGEAGDGEQQALLGKHFFANIVWMAETRFTVGMPYDLKLGSRIVTGEITEILEYINPVSEGPPTGRVGSPAEVSPKPLAAAKKSLSLNEIAHCRLRVEETVVFDSYSQCKGTGAFIVIDRLSNLTIAAGMITGAVLARAPRLEEHRQARLHGHRGATLFLSGTGSARLVTGRQCPPAERRHLDDACNDVLGRTIRDWFSTRGGCCVVLDARAWKRGALRHHLETCSPAYNAAGLLTCIIVGEEARLIEDYCKGQSETYRCLPAPPGEEHERDVEAAARRVLDELLATLIEQEPPIILDQDRYRP